MTTLLGFSGYARSGKDTAVLLLAEEGYRRVAFADKLRDVIYALNPIVAANYTEWHPGMGASGFQRLTDIIDREGWAGYKSGSYSDEIRGLLQRLGTEAGRQTLWDDIWVDAALRVVDNNPLQGYAFSDCRFPNEAHAIRSRGGKMIRITRPGVGPANEHPSETGLDDYPFDIFIDNDGTPGDLKQKIMECL